jgi:hypothetical protein
MKKIIFTIYMILILLTTFSCNKVFNPTTGNHTVDFKVDPLSATLKAGESIDFYAYLNDTLTGNRLPDKSIYWEIMIGSGVLSSNTGNKVTFKAPDQLSSTSMTTVIRVFPQIDMRYEKDIAITVTSTSPVLDTGICFVRDIQPIFNSNCAIKGCHDQNGHEDVRALNSYSNIVSQVIPGNPNSSRIYKAINGQGEQDERMPPPPKPALTQAQINLIYRWIAEGAQNKNCDLNPVGGCDTTNVTYSKSMIPIFQLNCIGCHSGSKPQGGVTLDNYSSVQTVVNNGYLLGAVKHLPKFVPMPGNNLKISDCNIRQIEIWIQNGAKND